MNESTRYAMGIYQVAQLLSQALDYAGPVVNLLKQNNNGEQLVKAYESQVTQFQHFLEPNMPFARFCAANGEQGEKIFNHVKDIARDVYGIGRTEDSDTPFVSIVTNADSQKELRVETSLLVKYAGEIVSIHEVIIDILNGYINTFEKDGTLEPELKELFNSYDLFYRARSMHVVSSIISAKFIELNNVANSIRNAKRAQGVDVTSPEFNIHADPSIHFIDEELKNVIGLTLFIKSKIRNQDPTLLGLFDQFAEYLNYLNGSKKLEEGRTMQDVLNTLVSIFNAKGQEYTQAWLQNFNNMYQNLVKYEQEMRASQAPAPEAK